MRSTTLVVLLVAVSLISLVPFAAGNQTPQVAINGCAAGANCDMDPGYVPYTLTLNPNSPTPRVVSFGMELTLPGPSSNCQYMPECSTVPDSLPSGTKVIPIQVCSTTYGCEYTSGTINYVEPDFALTTSGCCTYYTYHISFNIPIYMNGLVFFSIPADSIKDSNGNVFPPTNIDLGYYFFPFMPNGPDGGCIELCGSKGGGGSSGGSSGGMGGGMGHP